MNDDTIYRQEAIDALRKALFEYEGKAKKQFQEYGWDIADWIEYCTFAKNMNDIDRQTILNLPPAQPEQRWIPCSEETGDGYPDEDGFYYVTEQNYGFYLDADYKQRVTHTSHFKNGDFTDRFYTENNSNITAWMPLPEPWKGADDDPCRLCRRNHMDLYVIKEKE